MTVELSNLSVYLVAGQLQTIKSLTFSNLPHISRVLPRDKHREFKLKLSSRLPLSKYWLTSLFACAAVNVKLERHNFYASH